MSNDEHTDYNLYEDLDDQNFKKNKYNYLTNEQTEDILHYLTKSLQDIVDRSISDFIQHKDN